MEIIENLYLVTRVVFVLEKDSFGKKEKFAGVYMADGWDDYEDAERWKKISLDLIIPRNNKKISFFAKFKQKVGD